MTEKFLTNALGAIIADNEHTAAAREPEQSATAPTGRQLACNPQTCESNEGRTHSTLHKAARNPRNRRAFVSVRKNRRHSAEIDQLARILIPDATGQMLALTRNVVIAEIDVRRLEAARADLIRTESARLDAQVGASGPVNPSTRPKPTQVKARRSSAAVGRTILRVARELFELKRQHQRARARKSRAVRLLRKHLNQSSIER